MSISFVVKWDASSRRSLSLYCLMRYSDQMTIVKTHPTLWYEFWKIVTHNWVHDSSPFDHSIFLMFHCSLTWAFWDVSIWPFWKSSQNLFHSFTWIFTVISINAIKRISSITATMLTEIQNKLKIQIQKFRFVSNSPIRVIIPASLSTSFEVFFHSIRIIGEFQFPHLDPSEGFVIESARIHDFTSEFDKTTQSLERVTRRHFFIWSRSNSSQA